MAGRWLRRGAALIVLATLLASAGSIGAQAQGGDDLAALRDQVSRLHGQGKYAEAVPLAERYVALARQKHDEEHAEFAAANAWLAIVYRAQGRYAEAMLLLGKFDAASACSMVNPPSDEELFAKASTVFVGHIFRTEEIEIQIPMPGGPGTRVPAMEGTFRLVEILKGEPPADRKVISSLPDMCVQWLMVGLDYLIFLDEGSNIIVSALDKGTRPLRSLSEKPSTNDWLCQGRECVLGKLRELSKKAQ